MCNPMSAVPVSVNSTTCSRLTGPSELLRSDPEARRDRSLAVLHLGLYNWERMNALRFALTPGWSRGWAFLFVGRGARFPRRSGHAGRTASAHDGAI
jgi:hypothetical protein